MVQLHRTRRNNVCVSCAHILRYASTRHSRFGCRGQSADPPYSGAAFPSGLHRCLTPTPFTVALLATVRTPYLRLATLLNDFLQWSRCWVPCPHGRPSALDAVPALLCGPQICGPSHSLQYSICTPCTQLLLLAEAPSAWIGRRPFTFTFLGEAADIRSKKWVIKL
jgi:hypothetical protein